MTNAIIVKTYPKEIDTATYNCQETGLASALIRSGIRCDVMCASSDGAEHEDIIEVGGARLTLYRARAFKTRSSAWLRGCDGVLSRYDMIISGEYQQMYSWRLAGTFQGKVVIYHGPYASPYVWKYNRAARVFDALFLGRYKRLRTPFVAKSALAADYLKSKGLADVTTAGVGIDISQLAGSPGDEGEVLAAEMLGAKGLKLLYIGVIEDRRNTLFLIDVLETLIRGGTDATLVVIGRVGDAAYGQAIREAVARKGLGSRIIYRERMRQSDLAPVYKAADAFLFPTRYDIYGMVLLEAMYFGVPVISTLCGGSRTMIESGVNGIINDSFDASSWAASVLAAMSGRGGADSIGARASSTIRERFTWDTVARTFTDIYETRIRDKN